MLEWKFQLLVHQNLQGNQWITAENNLHKRIVLESMLVRTGCPYTSRMMTEKEELNLAMVEFTIETITGGAPLVTENTSMKKKVAVVEFATELRKYNDG